jgi:hypothetical protein
MGRSIALAIIIAAAAITTAWPVSSSGPSIAHNAEARFGGGGSVPRQMPPLW